MSTIRLAATFALFSAAVFAQGLEPGQFEARRKEYRDKYAAAKSLEEKKAIFEEFKKLALASGQDPAAVGGDEALLAALEGGGSAVGGTAAVPVSGGTGLGAGSSGGQPGQPDPFEPIAKVLRQFPIGLESLASKNGRKIPVKFVSGGQPARAIVDTVKGTVVIEMNKDLDPITGALYFVHEIYHATQFLDGKTAQPDKMGMEEYVEKMVREESDGTARSIRGRMELEAALKKKVDVPTFPGEGEYRWAYKVTIEDPLAKKTVAQSHEDAADYLFFVFYWLDRYGPSSLMAYREFYTRDWKKANAKKP